MMLILIIGIAFSIGFLLMGLINYVLRRYDEGKR